MSNVIKPGPFQGLSYTANPYFKIVKKNEAIHLSIEGDITFQEVALGIETYLELISEQLGVSLSFVKEALNQNLTQIEEKKLKLTKPEINKETEVEGYVNV